MGRLSTLGRTRLVVALSIGVVGCGYLGAAHAASMAHLGHNVVGFDVDSGQGGGAQQGESPRFFEPDLEAFLGATLASGRLAFASHPADLETVDVAFVCVGTPQLKGELAAGTSSGDTVVEMLAQHITAPALVVGKSTAGGNGRPPCRRTSAPSWRAPASSGPTRLSPAGGRSTPSTCTVGRGWRTSRATSAGGP